MVCIGTIGKCNLIERECAFNQQINSLTPVDAVDSRYLLVAVRSRSFQDAAWKKSSSTTIAILNKGKWLSIPVPLPPLAEQKRIVAKVDELMALCDRLEAQQQERETRHAALAQASLARFADAPTPANLPFLFHLSYAIPPPTFANPSSPSPSKANSSPKTPTTNRPMSFWVRLLSALVSRRASVGPTTERLGAMRLSHLIFRPDGDGHAFPTSDNSVAENQSTVREMILRFSSLARIASFKPAMWHEPTEQFKRIRVSITTLAFHRARNGLLAPFASRLPRTSRTLGF